MPPIHKAATGVRKIAIQLEMRILSDVVMGTFSVAERC
jgi:hypothetical protein